MGHVMRCIAIAQALQAGGAEVTFIARELPGRAAVAIESFGFRVIALPENMDVARDAAATIDAARSCAALLVVVDLNHADTLADEDSFVAFLEALRSAGLALTVIDGGGAECISLRRPLPASAIAVPYLNAEKLDYQTLPGTAVLAGPQYFPLRQEFRSKGSKAIAPEARRILVSLGGGDVARDQSRIVDALDAVQHDLSVRVTGGLEANPADSQNVEVLGRVANMAKLIGWADLAILGSGLTRYEAAALGTPSLSFSLREEHAPLLDESAAAGITEHGGLFVQKTRGQIAEAIERLIIDAKLREFMSRQGQRLIDGQGASRLAAGIRALEA